MRQIPWLPETSKVLRWWKNIWIYFKNETLLSGLTMEGAHYRVLMFFRTELVQLIEHPVRDSLASGDYALSKPNYCTWEGKEEVYVLVNGLLLWGRRVFLLIGSYFCLMIYKYILLKLESIFSPKRVLSLHVTFCSCTL